MVIQCAGRVAVPRFESLGAYSRTGRRLVFLLEEVPRRAQGFLIHALGHARTSFQISFYLSVVRVHRVAYGALAPFMGSCKPRGSNDQKSPSKRLGRECVAQW